MGSGLKCDVGPLVSIGLPVYNGAAFLERALKSLVEQSYTALEIIISNNASTDDTAAIASAFAAQHSNIRVINQTENLGAVENFRFVLHEAKGSYFMWAAHDDQWAPDFVQTLVDGLERDAASDVAMCGVRRVASDGKEMDPVRFTGRLGVEQGWLQLALQVAGGSPHHFFIYGLFRRTFLLRAFHNFPRVAGGDRLFAMALAMSTRLTYIDKLLWTRLVNEKSFGVRYADEHLGKLWQDPLRGWRAVAALPSFLLGSQSVPRARKLATPLITLSAARTFLGGPRSQAAFWLRYLSRRYGGKGSALSRIRERF